MRIMKGDLFNPPIQEKFGFISAICIPTNGQIKTGGKAVMGAGVAKVARDKWPGIDVSLGNKLAKYGNRVHHIWSTDNYYVFSFPTKSHWKIKSDLCLIDVSAKQIRHIINLNNYPHVYLPVVGCGLGGLSWKGEVKPLLEEIFDDRFIILIKE